MSDAIRVNGSQLEWGSIVLKLGGEPFYGVTGITYSQKRERVKAYGTGRHHAPRGRTRGKYSAEGKLTMWKSTAQALRNQLAAQSTDGSDYGDVEFDVVAQYIEDDEEPITVELLQCVIAGEDSSEEESADPLKEEIALDVMYIKKTGASGQPLTLFDNSDGTR